MVEGGCLGTRSSASPNSDKGRRESRAHLHLGYRDSNVIVWANFELVLKTLLKNLSARGTALAVGILVVKLFNRWWLVLMLLLSGVQVFSLAGPSIPPPSIPSFWEVWPIWCFMFQAGGPPYMAVGAEDREVGISRFQQYQFTSLMFRVFRHELAILVCMRF